MTNPYDEVLYIGRPFPQTHPGRLAAMARLFGMTPAPLDRCRVLEIGCGDGGNLIPIAYALPQSEFVGLDLGARGIEAGQRMAQACGVSNVSLQCRDILDAGAELGEFDYIIAHGVFSWVPPHVQDGLLALCGARLTAHGVAYISHSVYPGAHARAMIAEIMQYHTRRWAEPERKVEQARALMTVLAARPSDDPYSQLLRSEAEEIADRTTQAIYHDELSECHPLYFHEFMERAGTHGLQYLGEADFFEMQDTSEPPEIAAAIRQASRSLIEKEQYLDFLRCRRFRQTLLCRNGLTLQRRIESSAVREFDVFSAGPPGLVPPNLPTTHPAAIALAEALGTAWPAALSFDELCRRTAESDRHLLADLVLAFYAGGQVQLHVQAPRVAESAGDRPRASAIARYQAEHGPVVTNLCHRTVRIDDEMGRRLLRSLDGTRDRASLAEFPHLEAGLHSLAKLALLES